MNGRGWSNELIAELLLEIGKIAILNSKFILLLTYLASRMSQFDSVYLSSHKYVNEKNCRNEAL